jgi:hypothetical protein
MDMISLYFDFLGEILEAVLLAILLLLAGWSTLFFIYNKN